MVSLKSLDNIGRRKMKQFLYLDTDIVNSIIAQSDQGLIQSFSDEKVSSETEVDDSKYQ